MESQIVGLNGQPLEVEDDTNEVVSNFENDVADMKEAANSEMDPLSMLMNEQLQALTKLAKLTVGPIMSRGDLAQATRQLFRSVSAQFRVISLLLSDVNQLVKQSESLQFNTFMAGNTIAALSQLLLEKNLITKEEMDAKWKDVMAKAREDMQKTKGPAEPICDCACDGEGCDECSKA
jgi:hypothetical protein